MDRRQFLKALPLTAGLAGCVTESGPSNSTTESNEGRTPTTTSTNVTSVETPSSVFAQFRSSYRYGVNDDGIGVLSPEHDQFAFVGPPVSDEGAPPSAFQLALGDEHVPAVSSVPGFTSLTPGVEAVYTKHSKTGLLMFDVPTTEADSAALLYDGTRYPLSDDARDRLATAPAFSLTSVSVPESVTPGENIRLSITVKNEGDARGTYLAGVRAGGYPKTIDIPVEPGEEETGAVTYEAYGGVEAMYFDFDYPGGDEDYEVTIESETTSEAQ